jgi:hypothetical protein
MSHSIQILPNMCAPVTQKMLERDGAGGGEVRQLRPGDGGCACVSCSSAVTRSCARFRAGLRVLNVSQNNLDDGGCAVVFDAVAKCASLEVLYVEDNKASFMAGKSLAKLLDGDETDSMLVELYVGWNTLRGCASVDVATALQKNYRLKVAKALLRQCRRRAAI